jgi:hypothetical protein
MCIKQVQAWQHGEALFNTELEAVEAALQEYAQKLFRDHSSNPMAGLVDMTDKLVPLLQRYKALCPEVVEYVPERRAA